MIDLIDVGETGTLWHAWEAFGEFCAREVVGGRAGPSPSARCSAIFGSERAGRSENLELSARDASVHFMGGANLFPGSSGNAISPAPPLNLPVRTMPNLEVL